MEIVFFIAAIIAVATTLRVITASNAVHALLYLIVSLLAVAVIFYDMGAQFAAALEVIVYGGAIMLLFVFVVMMLSLTQETVRRERDWIRPRVWIGPGILSAILLAIMAGLLSGSSDLGTITAAPLSAHEVGTLMFGPYLLVVELAAFMLLAALVVAAHVARDEKDPTQSSSAEADKTPRN